MDENEGEVGDGIVDQIEEEETETNIAGSEEMELSINRILEKIENFTQLVPIITTQFFYFFFRLSISLR